MTEKNNKEKKLEPPEEFLFHLEQYLIDLECIKEMYEVVIPTLNEKDAERKEAIEDIVKSKSETEDGKIVYKPKSINGLGELKTFLKNLRKLSRGRNLFKRNAVVSIVSRYDEFLCHVLEASLRMHPEWLNESEKHITYKDLFKLESLETAKNQILQNEINNLMYASHSEQIEYLDKKLKLGLKDNFRSFNEFIEITARRHLFVHTGGRVSCQYLETCKGHNIDIGNINEKDNLSVSKEYFIKVFDCFYELGLRIGHAAYRRLFPQKIEEADGRLNSIGFDLLESENWELAEFIFDFAINIPSKYRSNGEMYYYFLINKAIALKEQGKNIEDIISKVNWAAFHPKYHIAIAVLEDNYEKATELMISESVKEAFSEEAFRSFPLFRGFRQSDHFKESYKTNYGKDFEIEYVTDNKDVP